MIAEGTWSASTSKVNVAADVGGRQPATIPRLSRSDLRGVRTRWFLREKLFVIGFTILPFPFIK